MSSEWPPWIQASVVSSAESEWESIILNNVIKPGVGLLVWTNCLCWVPGLWAHFTHPSSLLCGAAYRCWGGGNQRHSFLMIRLNLSFCWFHNAWESNCSSLLGPNSTRNKASFLLTSLLTFIALITAVSTWQPWSVPCIAAEITRSDWEVCW